MANWSKYSAEELLSLYEAIKAPGLVRYLEEVDSDGMRDLLNKVADEEARGRVKLARQILGLKKEIQSTRQMQSPDLTSALK